jgi:hypothetical protein
MNVCRKGQLRIFDVLRIYFIKKLFTLLDLCVSSLRRGHANLLCIVPILTDDPRRESEIIERSSDLSLSLSLSLSFSLSLSLALSLSLSLSLRLFLSHNHHGPSAFILRAPSAPHLHVYGRLSSLSRPMALTHVVMLVCCGKLTHE